MYMRVLPDAEVRVVADTVDNRRFREHMLEAADLGTKMTRISDICYHTLSMRR